MSIDANQCFQIYAVSGFKYARFLCRQPLFLRLPTASINYTVDPTQ